MFHKMIEYNKQLNIMIKKQLLFILAVTTFGYEYSSFSSQSTIYGKK
jgi:hypothetical protein